VKNGHFFGTEYGKRKKIIFPENGIRKRNAKFHGITENGIPSTPAHSLMH